MTANARPQEVATFQEQPPPTNVVRADSSALMEMISRIATDPTSDVDKFERMVGLYERIKAGEAKGAYMAALSAMQPELPVVTEKGRIEVPEKNGKTGHSTPYAKWEDINDAIRPILAKHGFSLTFRVGTAEDGKITVTGVLGHRDGHAEDTMITLMHDSSGSKNSVQAVGSSTSYGKRYTAMALLNITTRGEDDDGKKAGEPASVTPEQAGEIQALMEDVGADRAGFLAWIKADSIAAIPAKDFDKAIQGLNAKRGAK